MRGEHAAQCIQLPLEYTPAPPFDAGNADTAPTLIRYAAIDQTAALMGDTRKRVKSFANRTT